VRRTATAAIVAVAGLLVLVDLAIANPTLGLVAGWLTQLVVILAASVGVAGALALLLRHLSRLGQGEDWIGSGALLVGMGLVLVPGLLTGGVGADAPAVRWIVAALMAPLIAALLALVFPLLLLAARRGLRVRGRETALLLAGAIAVLVLLLPLGGNLGGWLSSAAAWVQQVPLAAVLRGLLLGVALMAALTAARVILGWETGE
jgi:hypothetical protein